MGQSNQSPGCPVWWCSVLPDCCSSGFWPGWACRRPASPAGCGDAAGRLPALQQTDAHPEGDLCKWQVRRVNTYVFFSDGPRAFFKKQTKTKHKLVIKTKRKNTFCFVNLYLMCLKRRREHQSILKHWADLVVAWSYYFYLILNLISLLIITANTFLPLPETPCRNTQKTTIIYVWIVNYCILKGKLNLNQFGAKIPNCWLTIGSISVSNNTRQPHAITNIHHPLFLNRVFDLPSYSAEQLVPHLFIAPRLGLHVDSLGGGHPLIRYCGCSPRRQELVGQGLFCFRRLN